MIFSMRAIFVLAVILPGLLACAGPAREARPADASARVLALLDDIFDRGLSRLGQPNAFGRDSAVRIGLPDEWARAEKSLRRFGLERLLEDLQHALNHTAEAVMPPAKTVLRQTAAECFVPDPALLTAGPDAITRRLRARCDSLLLEHLRPLVAEGIRHYPAAAPIRRFNKRLTALDRSLEIPRVDLEPWLARAMLNGIYSVLADEERRARRQ
jgi:Protein of unknown function (DUF4197)